MSNFPKAVDSFVKKLDKKDIPYVIRDEAIALYNGVGVKELDHDNANNGTIEIWSGPNKSGVKINSYVINESAETPWKTIINVMCPFDMVFITYESLGDQVEAADINSLQDGVVSTQTELLRHSSDIVVHVKDGIIDGGSFK